MSDIFPNFVFKKNKKRAKKTYAKNQFILDDDINNNDSALQTSTHNCDIESKVSHFISVLNNKNNINNDLLSKEIANNIVTTKNINTNTNISKYCYNNRRTMLIHNNDEEDEEINEGVLETKIPPAKEEKINARILETKLPLIKDEEMSDNDVTLVTSVLKPKLSRSKTSKNKIFSNIINSNSNLKYQQDYEFLMNNKLPLYLQLLNLIDTMTEDEEFKKYLIKSNLTEFLNHCLKHQNNDDPEGRHLIMLALIELNVTMEEDIGIVSKPLVKLTTKSIISSINDTFQLNCITNVNKFTKSTISNFIKSSNLNHITNHRLCIKLWSMYYNHLPQLLQYVHILVETGDDHELNSKYDVKYHVLLPSLILIFGHLILDDMKSNMLLLEWFLRNHQYALTDKSFSMAFILLTNNKSLLDQLDTVKVNKIISSIMNAKASCISTEDRDILQLQICQMALCLNLTDYIDDNIQINDWDKILNKVTQQMIPQLKTTFSTDDDNEFNLGMFILLLFSISCRSNQNKYKIGNSQDEKTLLNQLKSFKLIADNNITITKNIDFVTEKFT